MSKVALRLLQMCGLPGPEVVGTRKWPEVQVWGLRHHSFPYVGAPSSDLHTPIPISQPPSLQPFLLIGIFAFLL